MAALCQPGTGGSDPLLVLPAQRWEEDRRALRGWRVPRGGAAVLSSFIPAEHCFCSVMLIKSCLGTLAKQSFVQGLYSKRSADPGPRKLCLPAAGSLVPMVPDSGLCSVAGSPRR